jgi:uncharacterized protein (DUF1810 family)
MRECVNYNSGRGRRHRVLWHSAWASPLVLDMNFDLERFVEAQNPVYAQVCRELRQGRKQGHWMWFIFPQLKGLGHSSMASRFGIASADEARAYLAHPILGPRLEECTSLVNGVEGVSVEELFGYPDDMKFRSSMTLFAHVSSGSNVFAAALKKYYSGQPDRLTLELLNR